MSLCDYDLLRPPRFVGLHNYTAILTDPAFWSAVRHTLVFALEQVPLGTVVALAVAVLLNQGIAGRDVYRTIIYLPQAASYVVVALVWSYLYDPVVGPVNLVIRDVGWPTVHWLTDAQLAMPSLVIMSIWRNLGYFMVIYLAALQGIPRELREAAAIDGANAVRTFRHVTLPLLRNVTSFVLVTWFLGALQMFTQAYVMTGGGPVEATTTVVFRIYQEAFLYLRVGRASAIAVMLFVVVAVLTLATRLLGRRWGART
ncbi:carbohydrate ABC transporter permease [Actinopolymorpha rutila]|uniref:carbohydrate ABC transporter permease n=1 Tax=Actinopolymorpha rutila TaxID=446787 RepID=UPI00192D2292|nr:sugar ABC transporter permease [Actinopolymorpha rutila]